MSIRRSQPIVGWRCIPIAIFSGLFLGKFCLADSVSSSSLDGASRALPRAVAITLAEAIHRAELMSGVVRRARADKQWVASRYVGARVLFPANPVVALGTGARREEAGAIANQGTTFAAHVEQTIEVAGQRSARVDQVAREVDVAGWRERVALSEIRARVRASYVGVQLADAQVRAAQRRGALVDQLVEGIRARVAAGASSSVDLELARIERGRATRERLGADLALGVAETELRVLLDFEPGVPLSLSTSLGSLATAGELAATPLATLVARARHDRAELKALESSLDAVDAELVRLRREASPNPTLFLDFGRDLPGQVFLGAGVALPLPVWRRNQGERATNRAERERGTEERALVEREITGEVERNFRALTAQAEIVRVSETEVLPAAESAVELITQGWQAGKFDLFRVIQASREASEARRSYLESLGALWEASIALGRAVGAP
jgi:cobalt-zinc-cadmium efflux system outer membrane protein